MVTFRRDVESLEEADVETGLRAVIWPLLLAALLPPESRLVDELALESFSSLGFTGVKSFRIVVAVEDEEKGDSLDE